MADHVYIVIAKPVFLFSTVVLRNSNFIHFLTYLLYHKITQLKNSALHLSLQFVVQFVETI